MNKLTEPATPASANPAEDVTFADHEEAQKAIGDCIKTKFLIWCHARDLWWKPNQSGYTAHQSMAGRYSFNEALEIVAMANVKTSFPQESMVPEQEGGAS